MFYFPVSKALLFLDFDYVGTEVEEEEPSRATTENKLKLEYRKQGVLSGFKVASSSEYNLER